MKFLQLTILNLFVLTFYFNNNIKAQALDLSFNSTGIVVNSLGNVVDYTAVAIRQQADGKVVALVNYDILGIVPHYKLVRYQTNGLLDNTFGTNGVATTLLNTSTCEAFDLALQNDGKILVSGSLNTGLYNNAFIERFNSNGTSDGTWGQNGVAIIQYNTTSNETFNKLAIQTDGKIIAAGWTDNNTFNLYHNFIARFKSNGMLDSTYATNGMFVNLPNNNQNEILDIKIQTNGYLVYCGYTRVGFDTKASIGRLKTNGTYDSTFANNGALEFNLSSDEESALDLIIENNGKITISGWTLINTSEYDNFLARFNANGSIDNTFGTNGSVYYNINNKDNNPFGLVQQSDGKYLICGGAYSSFGFGIPGEIWIARYKTNGTYDSTFNNNGYLFTVIDSNETCIAHDILLQADGKILIAGEHAYNNANNTGLAICRYLNTGMTNPVLTVGSPNGGEQWNIGSTQTITWTNAQSNQIQIEYTTDGITWNVIANNVIASSLSYNWVIPAPISNNCKIRISEIGGTQLDLSDNNFSIINSTHTDLINMHHSLNIYPNPTSGAINFEQINNNQLGTKLILKNTYGAVIKNLKIDQAKTSIDLSNFPTGLIFYEG